MVFVPGGQFRMGSDRHYPEEAPARDVNVQAFWIDAFPVTNEQFDEFVRATGYVTVAERPLDPADYPGVPPARLKPGALVFKLSTAHPTADRLDLWVFKLGASWRRPEGRGSIYASRLDHPVTCIAYEDADAYAQWTRKALPTEAQWEYAARGGLADTEYAWGSEFKPEGVRMANTWPGDAFPYEPQRLALEYRTTRVDQFPPNAYGVFDMIGNVWEWTCDWYAVGEIAGGNGNGAGGNGDGAAPTASFNPALPTIRIPRRVVKGGSFLCAPNYCAHFRPSARQPQMIDAASVQIGFRCVRNGDV